MGEFAYPNYDIPGLTPPEVDALGEEFIEFHSRLLLNWRAEVVRQASELAAHGDEHAASDAHMLMSD